MKTISLKIPDEIYYKVEKYRKLENVNRTSFVLEALVAYSKKIERESLGKKLREESEKASEEAKKFSAERSEWDSTLLDGLEDEDWGNDGKT
ncbi:MAG: hypothetical protein ACJA08_000758 [Cyclobacteriaceae bacterium]|jgi:hypothetical protein